jgi:membrane protein DedA with SNARE-associated domain
MKNNLLTYLMKGAFLFLVVFTPLSVLAEKSNLTGVLVGLFGVFAFAIYFLIVGICVLAGIAGTVIWILMLVDCAKRDFPKENDKLLWILIIVLAGAIGAIVYYFVVKRVKAPALKNKKTRRTKKTKNSKKETTK